MTATRTFEVGLDLIGARPDRTYSTSTDRVLITLGGSVADLDRLEGATLLATLDVADLEPGHDVGRRDHGRARGHRVREREPGPGRGHRVDPAVAIPGAGGTVPSASPAAGG